VSPLKLYYNSNYHLNQAKLAIFSIIILITLIEKINNKKGPEALLAILIKLE